MKLFFTVFSLLLSYSESLMGKGEVSRPFLDELATFAEERTKYKIHYDASYKLIGYPGGDISPHEGVCSDLVIRSYRELGVDLQKLVHEDIKKSAKNYFLYTKEADYHIDHRRTINLLNFFKKYGKSFPLGKKSPGHKPGHIMIWSTGKNKYHIGIVAKKLVKGTQRPMIVHNFKKGPKIEDVLYKWPILGHFAYEPEIYPRPKKFVDAKKMIKDVKVDMIFYKDKNFIGEPIPGYNAPKCLLLRPVAKALKKVQEELTKKGLSLKLVDCYRPQMAVDYFVEWQKNPSQKMKKTFYPKIKKSDLFKLGYIAKKSRHSLALAVDLTLVKNQFPFKELDMGTRIGLFSPLSHRKNPSISKKAKKNRQKLYDVMKKHGFLGYSKEWWHFHYQFKKMPTHYYNFSID